MSLTQSLKVFFPNTPDPPDSKILEISTALDLALVQHVITTYVPGGFGQTFQAGVTSPTPFIVSLATYLTSVMSPILTTALSVENTPGSNHLLAWGAVQPSFDALIPAVPPFMAGPDGLRLWQAILFTIRTVIIPEFPPPPSDGGSEIGGDGIITPEVEI